MSDPMLDVDETVCWQCGAPANPACANTLTLYAKSREHKEGQGYRMVRGRWQDSVHVSIPRCEACRERQRLVKFLVPVDVVGSVLGIPIPLGGWMPVVGCLLGIVTIVGGHILYERLSGRRWPDLYPPLKRLYKAGWRGANN